MEHDAEYRAAQEECVQRVRASLSEEEWDHYGQIAIIAARIGFTDGAIFVTRQAIGFQNHAMAAMTDAMNRAGLTTGGA